MRVAYRVVGDADGALDAVQDAFVKIHTHIGSWDQRARFTSWAYRIVTNAAIDGIRRRGARRGRERLGLPSRPPSPRTGPPTGWRPRSSRRW